MKENLPSIKQNSKVALQKTKSLIALSNKILSSKQYILINDNWMQRLWDWADENNVPDVQWVTHGEEKNPIGLSRNKEELLTFTILSIKNNQLTELPKEIGNLTKLKKLDLATNSIVELPNEIGQLDNLIWLEMSYNQLKKLPNEIGKLTKVSYLSVEGNNLYELPNEIGNLSQLMILNVLVNKLNRLPKEIGNLTELKYAFLSENNLDVLPNEIGNLTNLIFLGLEGNNLDELPNEMGNLTNLAVLQLGKNNLTKLPNEIGNLTKLTSLSLEENNLDELPNEITHLVNLKTFNIENNPNLILTESQKAWVNELISNRCDVIIDKENEDLYTQYELARRYKYLDEFNVGREVPITPEVLDDDIPSEMTEKLADETWTFEEYLNEVSEYLEDTSKYLGKEKFNNLVQKLYKRDYDLGDCFERNVLFENFADNKLTFSSIAEGEDKKMLITHWGVINMFVKDIFGFETKAINIPRYKR